ncbi:MerR family transcriptional regulator [Bacillus sp. FJAT-49736]|uniref:MerR family transcriptional regulator n=1 Tax=Bacillus sp. FJAT-49736 TaxID=2833582 RepID=UPI001BC965D1|nr:MerR family transcriptional regulator [Bacillus sp. FJAT-49736]MBS4172794.1 MerR family transcriptional regulator [Bacillus sp. FJAT-49736]
MYSISEAAERTGISSYTIRYYEKIGLLPPANRHTAGRRFYSDLEIQFMVFLKSLKETGMTLEEMKEFVKDGCMMERIQSNMNMTELTPSIHNRIEILTKHLEKMEKKKRELEDIMSTTKHKLEIYYSLLNKGRSK